MDSQSTTVSEVSEQNQTICFTTPKDTTLCRNMSFDAFCKVSVQQQKCKNSKTLTCKFMHMEDSDEILHADKGRLYNNRLSGFSFVGPNFWTVHWLSLSPLQYYCTVRSVTQSKAITTAMCTVHEPFADILVFL